MILFSPENAMKIITFKTERPIFNIAKFNYYFLPSIQFTAYNLLVVSL
jgi:hypothetical protein